MRDRIVKNILFFVVGAYYLGGYYFLGLVGEKRGLSYAIDLPFERNIPLLPAMIFAYAMIYGLIAFAYLVIDDMTIFKKLAKGLVLCVTIHFIVFLIFPVSYQLRPVVDPAQGWAYRLVDFYYAIDSSYNSFPSLHVSNSFLFSAALNRYRPGWGKVLFPISALVAVSVVLVKQHYIVDVVAGALVGWFCYRQAFEA